MAIDDTNPQTVYVAVYDDDGDGTYEAIYKISNARTATAATLVSQSNFHRAEEMVVVNGALYVAANDATASKRGIWRLSGSTWTKIYDDAGATEWYSIDGYWTGSAAVIYAGSTDVNKAEPGTNPTLYRSVIRSNNAQAASPTWTYLSKSNAKIHTNMPMGDASGDIWWHSTEDIKALLGGNTFVCCQTLLDPSDATHKRVYVCGRAGLWRTDDGTVSDPTWYPSMRHMNATVTQDTIADPNNASRVYTFDGDWSCLYSTDKLDHVIRSPNSIGTGDDGCLALDSTTNPGSVSALYMGQGTTIAYNSNPATSSWVNTNLSAGGGVVKGVGVKYISGTGTVCLAGVEGKGIYRKVGVGANGTWSLVYSGGSVLAGLDVSNLYGTFSWAGGTSSEVYFTDRDNGVYRSLDAGVNWIKVTAPTGGWTNTGGQRKYSGCVAVDPTSAARCYVSSTEGVFYSSDANNAGQPTFTAQTISGMQTPGMVKYDDAGGVYVTSLVNGATRGKLFYKAAGGSWVEIASNNTYKAQCGLPMNLGIGPAPDHMIYLCGQFTGNCVGTQSGAADTTAPGEVTNLQAVPGGDHITLTWTNPGDADLAGVLTSRSTSAYPQDPLGSDGYVYDRGLVSTTDMTNVLPGELTYISVFTYDEVPNYSDPISIAFYACPGPVTNLTATPGTGKVDLGWINPTGDFYHTKIQRKTGSYPTGPTDGTNIYDSTGTSKSDTGLTNGTTYFYSVYAYDSLSNYSPVAQVTGVPAGDVTPPGPVTGFTVIPGIVQNVLSWTNPADGDFAGVVIQRKTGSYPTGPTDGTNVYSNTGTSYTDTSVSGNVLYYYCAYAKDEVPNYAAAAQANGKPFSQQTSYDRNASWNTGINDPTAGSDSEANVAGNMWKYEVVNATATNNNLNGATPWYRLAAESPSSFAWDGTKWMATHATYPRANAVEIGSSLASGGHWWQPRGVWVAQRAGTVTIGGNFGLELSAGGPDGIEWAVGKRVGSTYTLLASSGATPVSVTGGAAPVSVSLSSFSALQDIPVTAGNEIFWTFRGDVSNVLTSGQEWMRDFSPSLGLSITIRANEY